MTFPISKSDFSLFFKDKPQDFLYFAAHSHHPWPDCSHHAHQQYWLDSAAMIGDKWEYIFENIIPALQQDLATILKIKNHGKSICFAPNTHEFVTRLLSNLPINKTAHLLTTDSEFYSFDRQINRLIETGQVAVTKIPLDPIDDFEQRFIAAAQQHHYDMIFFSHVFFNAGYKIQSLENIVTELRQSQELKTPIIIDGYHAFMARPIDLSAIEKDVFYMAGGYKYAMSGEGCCFMHCPDYFIARPVNTGWFAAFDHLSDMHDVPYHTPDNGMRFMGATFDPSGLYRMHAVLSWLAKSGITPEKMDQHILPLMRSCATRMLTEIDWINSDMLIINPERHDGHGHFIALKTDQARAIYTHLKDQQCITDYRGNILRFGFGIYHDIDDVKKLISHLQKYQGATK